MSEAQSPAPVAVVGNGIVGLACAYALATRGHAVTVYDRGAVGEGTSTGNAGAIASAEIMPIAEPGLWKRVPGMLLDPLGPLTLRVGHLPNLLPWFYRFLQACRPEDHARGVAALARILEPTLDDHRAMLKDLKAGHLIAGEGALHVYRSEQGRRDAETRWRSMSEHGIEFFPLDRDGVRQHEPDLGELAQCGYFIPGWAHYRDPKELLMTLAERLREMGVAFERAEVATVETQSGRATAIRTRGGRRLPADRVVIACGAWSGRISSTLGDPFPVEADRGYNTTLPTPGIALKHMITFSEDSFVATPMSIGLRIGGAVEMGGLTAAPNYRRSKALLALARRYLPDLDDAGGTEWMGHRPGTPNSVPVISTSPNVEGVYYAFGHGHLGLTLSVTTGKIVADLIDGRTVDFDLAPYRIDRYR